MIRCVARMIVMTALGMAAGGGALMAAPPDQATEYGAETPKTIIALQQFRTTETVALAFPGGERGSATLVNLNPAINSWFVLILERPGTRRSYHLQNVDPARRVRLVQAHPGGLVISAGPGEKACEPWSGNPPALEAARASGRAYAPLCDGLLYLRNPVTGQRTTLEQVTDFLRKEVWGGDAIVGFVRDEFFRDAFAEKGAPSGRPVAAPDDAAAPAPAMLDPSSAETAVQPGSLGIAVDIAGSNGLRLGRWYPATGLTGVYVSTIRPDAIARSILESFRATVSALDPIESAALDYLIAFDLDRFVLGFGLGTDHPKLGWSPRPPAAMRSSALPGPDGIDTASPIVTTGMLSPSLAPLAVATFAGGFKREHGAFRYGPLSLQNHGSHYGFIEEGVVFSKLQPGLATVFALDDGLPQMKTWTAEDAAMLARIRFARQNGVALIERDQSGAGLPGKFVNQWGPGNWSGSAKEELRTLRAGACLHERGRKRFLVYGYFSTATPSAMARVFQAYGCSYAMLLDMNALEHTYLAVYVRHGERVMIEHLVRGMAQVDKIAAGRVVPRFVGFPDNRDFFYLIDRTPR